MGFAPIQVSPNPWAHFHIIPDMFKTRALTSVALFALLGAVLLCGYHLAWLGFIVVVLCLGLWEWARLGGVPNRQAAVFASVAIVLWLLAWYALSPNQIFPWLAMAAAFWIGVAPWCLAQARLGLLVNRGVFLPIGFVLVGAAGMALWLAWQQGILFLFSMMGVCFVADIFAYFFGKRFGKTRLAPQVSPGKSWEGAIAGAVCVLLISWLLVGLSFHFDVLQGTWQVHLFNEWHPALFSLWLLVLSAFSVVGDLFESLLKRMWGVKDSSRLLPGHGGVLDRIDAQVAVLPMAVLLVAGHWV